MTGSVICALVYHGLVFAFYPGAGRRPVLHSGGRRLWPHSPIEERRHRRVVLAGIESGHAAFRCWFSIRKLPLDVSALSCLRATLWLWLSVLILNLM